MNLLQAKRDNKLNSSVTRLADHLRHFVGHSEEPDSLRDALKDIELKLNEVKNKARN